MKIDRLAERGFFMNNAISAELMKLRRSRVLLLAAIASALPPAVKFLRRASGNLDGAADWRGFLTSGQELAVFGMLITVILLTVYLFTLEYRYGTAAALLTTETKRASLYNAKIVVLAAVIVLLLVISAASQLLFGALAVGERLSAAMGRQFVWVMAWYAFSYIMLAVVAALPAILTKRFVPAAIITLGFYILIFPFHAKNPYICPFMTPAIIAARIYSSNTYIFSFSYENFNTGVLPAGALLVCLAGIAWTIGITAYRKMDAVR